MIKNLSKVVCTHLAQKMIDGFVNCSMCLRSHKMHRFLLQAINSGPANNCKESSLGRLPSPCGGSSLCWETNPGISLGFPWDSNPFPNRPALRSLSPSRVLIPNAIVWSLNFNMWIGETQTFQNTAMSVLSENYPERLCLKKTKPKYMYIACKCMQMCVLKTAISWQQH